MIHTALLVLAIFAGLALAWLIATWYFADDEDVFAPKGSMKRVTFKQVVQSALKDVREVLNLDLIVNWIMTNAVAVGVFGYGLIQIADPVLRASILGATWQGIPVGALALLAVTWLASLKPAAGAR